MKLKLILLLSAFCSYYLHATDFLINPVKVNFKGVAAKDSTIVAYGDYGSILMSKDFAESWQQIKIFNQGDIINVFIDNESITAFTIDGQIGTSSDGGKSWKLQKTIDDSISYVLSSPDAYFVSVKSGLIKLSDKFDIIKKKNFENFIFKFFNKFYQSEYGDVFRVKNMVYFKNQLVWINDSNSTIYRYDSNLELIDTINLRNYIHLKSYYPSLTLCADSANVFIKLSDSIYKTSDFKSYEYVFHYNFSPKMLGDSSVPVFHKTIDNKLYCVTRYYNYNPVSGPYLSLYEIKGRDSAIKLGILSSAMPPLEGGTKYYILFWNDFNYINNQFTVVMNKKFAATKNLVNNKEKRICEMLDFSSNRLPLTVNNDSILIGDNADGQIFKSFDCGITYQREMGDSVFFNRNKFFYRKTQEYFPNENMILYGGEILKDSLKETFAYTYDYGQTFTFKKVPSINFTLPLSKIQLKDEKFILAQNQSYGKTWKTWIKIFSKSLEPYKTLTDSLFAINYIYSKSPNNFFVIASNPDSSSDIKYTDSNFTNWSIIKRYSSYQDSLFMPDGTFLTTIIKKELQKWREIIINKNNYLALVSINKSDSILKFELLDLLDTTISEIHKVRISDFSTLNLGIDCSRDTLYLLVNDTIFIISNINEKAKRYYYLLPNKGKIANGCIKRLENSFYTYYMDVFSPLNLYLITPLGNVDSLLLNVEEKVNIAQSYLFTYPPFPLPAKSKVSSLIYWDSSSDIGTDEMSVIDIEGNKIEDKENITIDRVNSYSGYLRWDCSGVPNGIYLIKIKHGTTAKSIKVIVER